MVIFLFMCSVVCELIVSYTHVPYSVVMENHLVYMCCCVSPLILLFEMWFAENTVSVRCRKNSRINLENTMHFDRFFLCSAVINVCLFFHLLSE